jgi:hypothetical protein
MRRTTNGNRKNPSITINFTVAGEGIVNEEFHQLGQTDTTLESSFCECFFSFEKNLPFFLSPKLHKR